MARYLWSSEQQEKHFEQSAEMSQNMTLSVCRVLTHFYTLVKMHISRSTAVSDYTRVIQVCRSPMNWKILEL